MTNNWLPSEITFLENNYSEMGKLWCCDKLNKTESQVRIKASQLGLQ